MITKIAHVGEHVAYYLLYDPTTNEIIEQHCYNEDGVWKTSSKIVTAGNHPNSPNTKFTEETVDSYISKGVSRGFVPVFHSKIGCFRYKHELDEFKHLISDDDYNQILKDNPKLMDEPIPALIIDPNTQSIPLSFVEYAVCDLEGNIIEQRTILDYSEIAWWNANGVPPTKIDDLDVPQDIKLEVLQHFGS